MHFTSLLSGKGINKLLQADFDIYGHNNFSFEIISQLPDNISIETIANIEKCFIEELKPFYNTRNVTNRHQATEEEKNKLSVSVTNYWKSLNEEQRIKANAHKVGRIFTEETRKILSDKASKRKWSEETKRKISETLKKTLNKTK
jgi:type III secretory pathway component EscR